MPDTPDKPRNKGGRPSLGCPICRHPDRLRIDREIISGAPLTTIAASLHIDRKQIYRHQAHAAQALTVLAQDRDSGVATTLIGEMRDVQRRAWDLLNTMSDEGDHRGAVLAIRECREVLESIDGMLTRAAEALNTNGMTIQVVDVASDGYCPECPHCTRPTLPEHLGESAVLPAIT